MDDVDMYRKLVGLALINSAVFKEFIEWLESKPAPHAPELHPVSLAEVEGGRYDGSLALIGICPACHGAVTHILNPEDVGADADHRHRVADCAGRCEGGYTLPATVQSLLGGVRTIDSRQNVRDFFGIVRGPDGEPINPSLGLFGPLLNWEDN